MIKLLVKETTDDITQENMKRLQHEMTIVQHILRGQWKFFKITLPSAVTNYTYPHLLGFVPEDIMQTSLIGAGALTWNYSLFDKTNINLTTTAACVVRGFMGRFIPGEAFL